MRIRINTEDFLYFTCFDLVMNFQEAALEQVLQNLIQNALRVDKNIESPVFDSTVSFEVREVINLRTLKYSPAGGPITVQLEQHDQMIYLTVTDKGIGIPQEALPNLFQRFYRAKNVDEQHITGLGIGLHVVKEIVTLHGGAVTVESQEGQGSTFRVCLPLAKTQISS